MSNIRHINHENNCAEPFTVPAAATGGTKEETSAAQLERSPAKVKGSRETIPCDDSDPSALEGVRMMRKAERMIQEGMRMMQVAERMLRGGVRPPLQGERGQLDVERPIESEGRMDRVAKRPVAFAAGTAATPNDGSLSLSWNSTTTTPTALKEVPPGRRLEELYDRQQDELNSSLRLIEAPDGMPTNRVYEFDCSSNFKTPMASGQASGRSHVKEGVSSVPSHSPGPFRQLFEFTDEDLQAFSPFSVFSNLSNESWTRQPLDASGGAVGWSEDAGNDGWEANAAGSLPEPQATPRQSSEGDPSPPASPSAPPQDEQDLPKVLTLSPKSFAAEKRRILNMTMLDYLAMQKRATGTGQVLSGDSTHLEQAASLIGCTGGNATGSDSTSSAHVAPSERAPRLSTHGVLVEGQQDESHDGGGNDPTLPSAETAASPKASDQLTGIMTTDAAAARSNSGIASGAPAAPQLEVPQERASSAASSV